MLVALRVAGFEREFFNMDADDIQDGKAWVGSFKIDEDDVQNDRDAGGSECSWFWWEVLT